MLDSDGPSGIEMSASAFLFPLPFFAVPTGAALTPLSGFTLTTFHPNSSFNHPHFVQDQPRLLPAGRSRSNLIRAAWSADSSGESG